MSPTRPQKIDEKSDWRKKAHLRRLKANKTKDVPASDVEASGFQPDYTPLRLPDADLDFEKADPAAGKVESGGRSPYWNLLVSVGVVLAIVLTASMASQLKNSPDTADNSAAPAAGSIAQKRIRRTVEDVAEARRVVNTFMEAETPEEKAKLVRGGEAQLPAMLNYYSLHPDEPFACTVATNVEFLSHEENEFIIVSGTSGNYQPFDTAVELTAEGPKLDWRYLTGTGAMDWLQWIKERPARSVNFRVLASLDDYYAGEFADSSAWICLKLTDIAQSATVWAYAERTSAEGTALLRNLSVQGNKPVRLQGRFEFSAFSSDLAATPQVYVRSLSNHGWLDERPAAAAQ